MSVGYRSNAELMEIANQQKKANSWTMQSKSGEYLLKIQYDGDDIVMGKLRRFEISEDYMVWSTESAAFRGRKRRNELNERRRKQSAILLSSWWR